MLENGVKNATAISSSPPRPAAATSTNNLGQLLRAATRPVVQNLETPPALSPFPPGLPQPLDAVFLRGVSATVIRSACSPSLRCSAALCLRNDKRKAIGKHPTALFCLESHHKAARRCVYRDHAPGLVGGTDFASLAPSNDAINIEEAESIEVTTTRFFCLPLDQGLRVVKQEEAGRRPPIAVVLEGCEASLTHGRLEFLREKFCTLGHTLCVVCSRAELPPICLFISRGDATTRALGRILIDGVAPAAQPQVAEETTVGACFFLGPRT
mmetsp:Transcript_16501/g.46920  ORF Transcript_16501/g.46920 Transcript_16501/m.46920 type:complete len:269 (+) Transcript_16501:454-1260(+)